MAEARTWWETIKGESGELLEGVKALIREGNVRRIVIRQGDRSVAEFPLTVGVVGTVGAPVLAAVGAIVALLTNCSIAVQRAAMSCAVLALVSSETAGVAGGMSRLSDGPVDIGRAPGPL